MGIFKDNMKITQRKKSLKTDRIFVMLADPVTGELTEQLRLRQSREREGDHVILCSTFKTGFSSNFSFQFQVVRTSKVRPQNYTEGTKCFRPLKKL